MNKGRKNSNCKYKNIKDFYFQTINSPEKAYMLGFIAGDGHIRKRGFSIEIHKKDSYILEKFKKLIGSDFTIKKRKLRNCAYLNVDSQQLALDISRHLSVSFGKKSNSIRLPKFENKKLELAFLRGYFDADGSILDRKFERYPYCYIKSNSPLMLKDIKNSIEIPSIITKNTIAWYGNNMLDFLGSLYDTSTIHLIRKYRQYEDWCCWVPALRGGKGKAHKIGEFKFYKTDVKAIAPFKSRVSDSGFDLTLIREHKRLGDVILFDTGIKAQPAFGYYFDLVPRSSIIKSGYILANSVGVIDRSYLGPILVPLIKIDKNKPDLELPARLVQIVPRQIIHFEWEEVDSIEQLGFTGRGTKGFGSSGK